jgi:hypothetical protein
LALAKHLGVRTQNNHDLNAIDIDSRNFSHGGFAPLSDEEKQKSCDSSGVVDAVHDIEFTKTQVESLTSKSGDKTCM